jgi:hypothetical protein
MMMKKWRLAPFFIIRIPLKSFLVEYEPKEKKMFDTGLEDKVVLINGANHGIGGAASFCHC